MWFTSLLFGTRKCHKYILPSSWTIYLFYYLKIFMQYVLLEKCAYAFIISVTWIDICLMQWHSCIFSHCILGVQTIWRGSLYFRQYFVLELGLYRSVHPSLDLLGISTRACVEISQLRLLPATRSLLLDLSTLNKRRCSRHSRSSADSKHLM